MQLINLLNTATWCKVRVINSPGENSVLWENYFDAGLDLGLKKGVLYTFVGSLGVK